jgi:hypothetical protein
MIRSLFSIYGLLVAGWVGYSQWSGWSIDRVNELKNVPKSIRDNPGAWRSHYGGLGRYYGGK